MTEAALNTTKKALALNLDPLKYGTVVEIGAGQEVARWFFRAGATAGTIAKTMSAYDMKFSDEIYGPEPSGRYVSRARLERMLAQEFDLLLSRLGEHRPEQSTYFAFANTVATMGYRQRAESHGWVGIRLQGAPGKEPDEILLHVRMLDDSNVEQQEALGILGVNLIYGAFFLAGEPQALLRSLTDDLKWGRIEIDFIEFRGPRLGAVDNRLMDLELVKASVAQAVLFDPQGRPVVPADALHGRDVVTMRGEFRPVLTADMAVLDGALARFAAGPAAGDPGSGNSAPIRLAELTMARPAGVGTGPATGAIAGPNAGAIDTREFLDRVRMLSALGFHVLVSEYFRAFRVRQFLARYTKGAVAFVTDTQGFADLIREDYYDGLAGGMLEALGKLFTPAATVYVHPVIGGGAGDGRADGGGPAPTLDSLAVDAPLRPLVTYLRQRGQVAPLDDTDPALLATDRARVLADLREGGDRWRDAVPAAARKAIEAGGLLGHGGA